jgi:nitrogen-specific signal transduction histidine kinase
VQNWCVPGLPASPGCLPGLPASTLDADTAALAHPLRNSITGARMAVQLHLRRCRDSDRESLNVALRQSSLTEKQICDLLRRTPDAHQPPIPGRLDQLLITIAELLQPQCRYSNIRLAVELPAPLDCEKLHVADSEQMQASLLNLVRNAVEATGLAGQVLVQVSVLPSTSDEANTSARFVIRVDVIYSGPGVAEELRTRIFAPFVTGKPEGVGLGLTLAAQTAEDHGGSLTWERVAEMTRFRVEIDSGQLGRQPTTTCRAGVVREPAFLTNAGHASTGHCLPRPDRHWAFSRRKCLHYLQLCTANGQSPCHAVPWME